MRFSEISNPTVRFGAVFRYSKSYGAVRCSDKSIGAVRCGSPLNGFCYYGVVRVRRSILVVGSLGVQFPRFLFFVLFVVGAVRGWIGC